MARGNHAAVRELSRGRTVVVVTVMMLLAGLLIFPGPVGASHTPDPVSVTIAGSLQSELGCPGDWQPDCAATYLTYDATDGVWQGVFPVPAGSWDYKAALNNSWDENYGANAQHDGPNIPLPLSASTDVKFYYDHETHWIADNQNSVIATVPGSYQSALGCSGIWDPGCLRSWLQDPDGDGTYQFSTTAIPAGSYEVKVAIDESWDENYGAGGVPSGPNIPFNVTAANSTVIFVWDPATKILTVDVLAPPLTSVTVVGSLQSELGCPGDWQPDCADTHLTYDGTDDVWQGTFTVPAGNWEYKVALNNSWDENYGAGGVPNGPNIPFSLSAPTAVKFVYDHETHLVTIETGYRLGDRVWYDQDQDGIQDPSEPGFNGATVDLYDNATCSGSPMASTTTGATGSDGFYEFTDLLAGDYCLQFGDIPAGWSISPADQGADDSIDSDTNGSAQIPNISLSGDDPTEDMGVYVSGSLGDSVSCLSTGAGLANITVTLFEDFDGDGVADGPAIATTETDATGFYQFTGMEVGLAGDSSNLTQYILAVDTADPDLGTCNVPVSLTKYNPPLDSDSPGDPDNDFIFGEANYPPVANDDAYSTDEDTPLYVSAPGVLANDSDADGDPLTAVLITNVSNGVLILDPDGAFQYTPDLDFCGEDMFTYVANDGTADSNIGTATLTVNCVNDPPVADPNGPYSGVAGEAIVFDGTGSSDPEGDPLTFSWDWGDGSPTYGGATPTHVYEPGIFTLCLTVTDPGGLSDAACTTAVVIEPVPIDIDPSSCPNPFNVGARGVLPLAILGTEEFEVAQVDPASVRLEGVAPLRWSWEDVATPFEPYLGKFDAYDCTACGPDGYEDLSFKFKAQEVAAALGDVNDGDVLVLTLTGNLKPEFGGTEFIGEDVILIRLK